MSIKWKNFWIINSLFFLVLLWNYTCAQKSSFRIYDAIMIKGKPNLYKIGWSRINMIYEDSLLDNNKQHPTDFNIRVVNSKKVRREIAKITNNYPVCIDVESWLLRKPHLEKSVAKYASLLNSFNSRIKNDIGYYGVLPYADLNIYMDKANFLRKGTKDWIGEWEEINGSIKSIASVSDIAYPSCYTRFKDRKLWYDAFKMQIEKIKQIKPGIKIYAFLWPQYYSPGFKYNNEFIDREFWLYQLEVAYKHCDGIVIWAPPFESPSRNSIKWNSNWEWLSATNSFIKKKNIKSNIL